MISLEYQWQKSVYNYAQRLVHQSAISPWVNCFEIVVKRFVIGACVISHLVEFRQCLTEFYWKSISFLFPKSSQIFYYEFIRFRSAASQIHEKHNQKHKSLDVFNVLLIKFNHWQIPPVIIVNKSFDSLQSLQHRKKNRHACRQLEEFTAIWDLKLSFSEAKINENQLSQRRDCYLSQLFERRRKHFRNKSRCEKNKTLKI